MAVMTYAHARLEADYYALPATAQAAFDQLIVQADHARSNAEYLPLMTALAGIAGIPQGDIRRCGCSCVCGSIFDAEHPDAHVIEQSKGFNLGRVQCPTCADEHRETA